MPLKSSNRITVGNAGRQAAIWELLFKINQLILLPVLLWATWATKSIFEMQAFADRGPRYTQEDARVQELEIKGWAIANFPPPRLEKQLERLAVQLEDLNNELDDIKIILAKKHLE